jgi:hypothetical protein
MLFMCCGEARPGLTEQEQDRALSIFRGWKLPAGMEIKAHYLAAGGGDFVVVETDSASALLEATATWAPLVNYRVFPIVEVQDGVDALARAVEGRLRIV